MEYSEFLKTHIKVNITNMIHHLKGAPRGKWYDDLFDQITDPTYDLIGDREEEENWRIPTEFWVVSDALAEALLRKGELLTNDFGFWVWGREFNLDLPHPLTLMDCLFRAESWQLESEVLTQIYKESLRS